ncbi:MAG: TetR/AcrR family transcriptional regulator [Chitinophagales bacterium]
MGRGADTRGRLITEARSLFASQGYDRTTMAQIARAAGITEGAIYRHFSDKRALFQACIGPVLEEAFSRSLALVVDAADPRRMVQEMVEVRLQLLRENRESFDIIFTQAMHHPDLLAQLHDFVRAQMQAVGPVVSRLQERGWLKRRPNVLILGLGLTVGMWAVQNFQRDNGGLKDCFGVPFSQEQTLQDLVEFVLYGLAGEPAEVKE